MWTIKTDILSRYPIAIAAVLTLAFSLTLVASPAPAQEGESEHEVVVRRPVVVVRSGSDEPGFTWTMAGRRSFLGVQTVDLTPELRQHFGVPPTAGVLVAKVVAESPAAASDLRVGDIISAVNDEPIDSPSSLARAVGHRETGEIVLLEIWRDGKVQSMQSTLVEHEAPSVDIRQFHFPGGRLERWTTDDMALEGAIELEAETLNRAIERLNKELDSPEWHARVHSFEEHQGTLMKRIELLERRLREMEEELRSLEKAER